MCGCTKQCLNSYCKSRHRSSKHKHSMKSKCLNKPLKLNIVDGGTPGYTTTFDKKGVPTIIADNIFEAYKGAAYFHATDRMWQIFTFWALATGNLSIYFGATTKNIKSDTFFRCIVPTNTLLEAELLNVLPRSKNATYGALEGINKRIMEVNNSSGVMLPIEIKTLYGEIFQIPLISITDYIRMVLAAGVQVSSTIFGIFTQLDNFKRLSTLINNFGQNGQNMFNDLYPPQPNDQRQIKTATTSSNNQECYTEARSVTGQPIMNRSIDTVRLTEIPDLQNIHEELKAAWTSTGLPILGGSYGIVLSSKKTDSKDVVVLGAPQLDQTIPGPFWNARIKIKVDNMVAFENMGIFFFGVIAPNIVTSRNYDYTFSTSGQNASVLGRDAVILDIRNDVKLSRTEYIANGVPINIYVSNDESCYIFDTETFANYNQCIGMRTAYKFGKEALVFNTIEHFFSHNFQELYDVSKGVHPMQEIITGNQTFGDSQGNIGNFIISSWTQLPASINRQLPQTTFGPFLELGLNMYPNKAVMLIRKDLQDFNTPDGYYANWNQNFADCLEYVNSANTNNGNRGLVLESRINEFTKDGKINQNNFIDMLIAIANTQVLSNGIQNSGILGNFNSDLWQRYVPLIIDALNMSPSSSDRNAAQSIIESYKGNMVDDSSREQILDSPTVTDGYMLLAAIQSDLKWKLFGNQTGVGGTFDSLFPGSAPQPSNGIPIPVCDSGLSGLGYNILGNALLAALGGGFGGNSNSFDWTNGIDPVQLIVTSVDHAILNLGGLAKRPWGLMRRGTVTNNTSIFGPYPITSLKLNRAAYYKINQLNKYRTLHREITFCGQSGDPLSPHYIDQLNDALRWNLDEKEPFKSCKCGQAKTILDGMLIKYKYTPYPVDIS